MVRRLFGLAVGLDCAVAFALRTKTIGLVTERMVVPVGILRPVTVMPGNRPAVLLTVTLALALAVMPPLITTTLPRDSVVPAEALPVMLMLPPPSVSVAPVPAPATEPPPRRLFTLVPLLSSVSVPVSLTVLPRNFVAATPLYRTVPWLVIKLPKDVLLLPVRLSVPVPTLFTVRVLVSASLNRVNEPEKTVLELSQPLTSEPAVADELVTMPEPARLPMWMVLPPLRFSVPLAPTVTAE